MRRLIVPGATHGPPMGLSAVGSTIRTASRGMPVGPVGVPADRRSLCAGWSGPRTRAVAKLAEPMPILPEAKGTPPDTMATLSEPKTKLSKPMPTVPESMTTPSGPMKTLSGPMRTLAEPIKTRSAMMAMRLQMIARPSERWRTLQERLRTPPGALGTLAERIEVREGTKRRLPRGRRMRTER